MAIRRLWQLPAASQPVTPWVGWGGVVGGVVGGGWVAGGWWVGVLQGLQTAFAGITANHNQQGLSILLHSILAYSGLPAE